MTKQRKLVADLKWDNYILEDIIKKRLKPAEKLRIATETLVKYIINGSLICVV